MKKGWKKLFRLASPYKGLVVSSATSNVLQAIFTIVSIPLIIPFFQLLFSREIIEIPTPSGWDISTYLQYYFAQLVSDKGKEGALTMVCIFIVLVFFSKNLFRYLSLFFLAPVRTGIVRDLRSNLFHKFLQIPLSEYSEEKKGDMLSRIMSDVQEIEWSVLNVIEVIFKSPLIIIGSIIVMLMISPLLTQFVLILLIFTILVIGVLGKKLKANSIQAQEKLGELNSTTEEMITGLKLIRSMGGEFSQKSRFNLLNNEYKKLITAILRRRDLSSPLSEFLGIGVVAILLWYGANLVLAEELMPEVFFAFIFAFYQVIEPAKALSNAYYNIQKGLGALERVEDYHFKNTNFENKQVLPQYPKDIGVSCDNLNFSYDKEEGEVIKGISISINPGEKIGLVGPSGGGKTTLVDLVLGLYAPNSGKVMVGGINPLNLNADDRQQLIGVVTQDPFLFNGSIRDNILFGREYISEEALAKACSIAYVDEFIQELPLRLDTNVGDRGSKLSGGQRQRIAIARAIINNPPLLIMDEATSALDRSSELIVQKALDSILKDRTAIIIAHRLKTIELVDRILVINNGVITQVGNHKELVKVEGDYKKLVEMQTFAS